MSKHFYILSTGRCGTTFLSKLILSNNPSFGSVHQLPGSKLLNVRGNIALSSKVARENLTASLLRKYNHAPPPSSADPLKSVAFTFYLKILLEKQRELHDEVIIIHLVRDPRDFVSSFMNWKNRKLSGKIAHHLTPFWMPEPGIFKRWSMSKFEHFCWIWERKNRLFYEELAWFPGYHLFKMEDLKPDSDQLKQLLLLILGKNKAEIITKEKEYNSSIKKDFPYWEKWTPQQAGKLQGICSEMMDKFGYGGEVAWNNLIEK